MRVSYRWLCSLLGTEVPLTNLVDRLTMNGIEVEAVVDLGVVSGRIVVARILEICPHPNADQLVLCRVDAGKEQPLRIVCGAKNMKEGDMVPLALEGATLPNGMVLKRSKIRGEVSEGMMCSARELGWSDDASGLLILPPDWLYAVGLPFDALLELKITPNRPDCLSILGVARDLAASLGLPIPRTAPAQLQESAENAASYASVRLDAPQGCPRYTGRVIRNVTIGPSPLWLQRAVESAGMRSINNVVDVTNYILIERGHPLHAFDLDLVEQGKVIIRYAAPGEKVRTLDEHEHELCESDLLIADPVKPIALAGIMGCGNTEITSNTRNVFLECAYFDPPTIRRTSKRLAKVTESSYRFERGVDWAALEEVVDRAAALIAEVSGGTVCAGRFDVGPQLPRPAQIKISLGRLNMLSGLELSCAQAASTLISLGFEVTQEPDVLAVVPPTHRPDIVREADIVEEVTRILGYDKVPTVLPSFVSRARERSCDEALTEIIREVCVELGLAECMNYSFLAGKWLSDFGYVPECCVRLANPLSAEYDVLRPHLVPGLIQSILYNQNRANPDVWLFEVGKVFFHDPHAETGYGERLQFAAVLAGVGAERSWREAPRNADFFDGKLLAQTLLNRLNAQSIAPVREDISAFLHPGKAAKILVEGKPVIEVGELHPRLQAMLEIKRTVVVVWADFDALSPLLDNRPETREISPFPPVARDLALVADKNIPAAQIEDVIRKRARSVLASLRLFDIYEGERIVGGKRSLTYQLRFSAPDRTLTDEEVNQLIEKIIADLKAKLGVELRS